MSQNWAEETAEQLSTRSLISKGICLVLGGPDTGKTSLVEAIVRRANSQSRVGIIDADIGQSHIGPPTTVGWAVINNPQFDFSNLKIAGISFVGDITPVGHLLQLTAAIVQCFQQISKLADLVIIDTPGFIATSSACALWWTVQKILQPQLIIAVQRKTELSEILGGLNTGRLKIELVSCPAQIPAKSLQQRQQFRQEQFNKYFQDSKLCSINLSDVVIQKGQNFSGEKNGRLVALRDEDDKDIAIGQIKDWDEDKGIAVIRSPQIDFRRIRCLIIGDVSVELAED